MLRRLVLVSGVLVLVLGFVGPAGAQATTRVRLIVAVADVPAVDVWWGGRAVARNFDFASISLYLTIPAGTEEVVVTPAGQGIAAALSTAPIDVDANKTYTLAIVGSRDTMRFHPYDDTLLAPPPDTARIRVLHAAPTVGALAVRSAGGTPFAESLSVFQSSSYHDVAGGVYQFYVTPTTGQNALVAVPDTRLVTGTIYDVVVLAQGTAVRVEFDTYTPIGAPTVLPETGVSVRLPQVLVSIAVLLLAVGGWLRRGDG
jgi:hypothetical protein